MQALENKIPPPIVATAFAFWMWLVARWVQPLQPPAPWLGITAGVLVAAGAFVCLAGWRSFRQARTTVNPLKPETASSLVRSGIFQYTRNPMYLGFAIFLLAWACYLAAPAALLGVLAFIAYMNRFQITSDERVLAQLFGDAFHTYTTQVRRWL